MSIVTYNSLVELMDQGVLTPIPHDHINGASVDVRIGNGFFFESRLGKDIDLAAKDGPNLDFKEAGPDEKIVLNPLEFCLAATIEVFNLPANIACEFRLKSSGARAGLDQSLAVWCDPGWNGSVLTIELFNNLRYHRLLFTPGMKIGQVVFYEGEPVPAAASYATRGQYNNDKTATATKGIR